jgi:hypothetical protein
LLQSIVLSYAIAWGIAWVVLGVVTEFAAHELKLKGDYCGTLKRMNWRNCARSVAVCYPADSFHELREQCIAAAIMPRGAKKISGQEKLATVEGLCRVAGFG